MLISAARGLEPKSHGERSVIDNEDSYHALIEQLRRKAPAYIDLLTAETDDEFESAFELVLDSAVRLLARKEQNKFSNAR